MIKEAFLLCGGKGKRFGFDKRFIRIQGKPLYKYQLEKLMEVFPRVKILCKKGERTLFPDYESLIIEEKESESSLLCGIIAGLENTKETTALFLGVDMPMVPISALKMFRDYPLLDKVVVPFWNNKIHPSFGIYPKNILEDLKLFKKRKIFKMSEIINSINALLIKELPFIEEYPDALYNINWQEDFELLKKKYPELNLEILPK